MEDINVIIKGIFGRKIKVSIGQIEKDVIRMKIGLESQVQDGEE